MKIVQVIGLGAKKFGGLERFILELAKQLDEKGDSLIIIFDAKPKTSEYINLLSLTSAKWYVIPHVNRVDYFKKMYRLLKGNGPILVQTHFCDSFSILIIKIVSKLSGVKFQFAYEHCNPEIDTLRLKLIFSMILFVNKKMFCVSETSRKTISGKIKYFSDKLVTLNLGVENFSFDKEKARIKYNLPHNKILIANVAYHDHIKGVDILLDAIKILIDYFDIRNFVVCQIGGDQTGIYSKILYEKALKNGINENIFWMGIQNNVPEILSACDIYCQPSRSEGLPLSIMEAGLASLPVVASNVGGIPEIINEKNGILIEPNLPFELAKGLRTLINNSKLRTTMGYYGREYSKNKFNVKLQVSKLIQEYNNAITQ